MKKKEGLQPATLDELRKAEHLVLRSVQAKHFQEEMSNLKENNQVKRTSPLYQLDPFLDKDDILIVGGRLQEASIAEGVKHPVVLPKDHHVSHLIIKHAHETVKHQGRGMTFNEVRSLGYWIIGGGRLVKDTIHKCLQCKKLRRPVEEQKMANLPIDRL